METDTSRGTALDSGYSYATPQPIRHRALRAFPEVDNLNIPTIANSFPCESQIDIVPKSLEFRISSKAALAFMIEFGIGEGSWK